MANVINWLSPNDNNVGSVLIYRAAGADEDRLGSRTIITTIGAKDAAGSWVGSYNDASGGVDSLYRVQFWDGTGSSELSDVLGPYFSELLCTFDDVRRLARIQHTDVGSEDIYYAIKDATDTVFYDVGDPVKQTVIFLDSETGVSGRVYDMTGDLGPIYQVREVWRDIDEPQLVNNTDYQVDYAQGNIQFTNAFIGSWNSRYVTINWIPTTYHILIKNLAALELLEGEMVFNNTDVESPSVKRLKTTIERVKESIRPKGLYSIKSDNILSDYDVVGQVTDRSAIYFNK